MRRDRHGSTVQPFQRVADRIDLKAALTRGAESNDLLPPRPEDNVGGEVGNRFTESLRRSLERGSYDPVPAYFVPVPKSSHATRPAALLNLADRVVLEALVATLRPRIETALLGSNTVVWPRGNLSQKNWRLFEASPLQSDDKYVIIADISAFYESVDHEELSDRLIRMTGRRDEVEALQDLLDRTMSGPRGLPQGLGPSDALATAYIAQVDFSMIRDGFKYVRHGDDIRIACPTYEDARRAIFLLEMRIREAGLLLNAYKSKILRRSTYERELEFIDRTIEDTKLRLLERKLEELADDSDALQEAITAADREQLNWDLFYHGNISMEDAIEELRPHLQPDDTLVAERLFADTLDAAPGSAHALESDAFHQRLVASLVRLAAARSVGPLEHMGMLLRKYPDKTQLFCTYLSAVSETQSEWVAAELGKIFSVNIFRTEWEAAWAARTLGRVSEHVPIRALRILRAAIANPHGQWLFAVESAKVLAARGELARETLSRLWNACPATLRADLVIVAAILGPENSWAKAFLQAAQDDPIHLVVAKQFQARPSEPSAQSVKKAKTKPTRSNSKRDRR
jgi:hypothetical protein